MMKILAREQHRQYLRVPFEDTVFFEYHQKTRREALLKDLSLGGAFLITQEDFRVEESIHMYLPIPIGRTSRLCMIRGRVVHTIYNNRKLKGYGIQFDMSNSRHTREILSKFIRRTAGGASPVLQNTREDRRKQALERRAAHLKRKRAQMRREEGRQKSHFRYKAASKPSKMNATYIIAALSLSAVALVWGFITVKNSMWKSSLVEHVQMHEISIQGETLRAQVDGTWLNSRNRETKMENLSNLSELLRSRGITGAILTNEFGEEVIKILRSSQDSNEPKIQILDS